MLKLSISFDRITNETVIGMRSEYLDSSMYAHRVGEFLKEEYDKLVEKLNTDKVRKLYESYMKQKDSTAHWEVGKIMADFIRTINNGRVDAINLPIALSKSIGGNADFWETRLKFYGISQNGEYNRYHWWACSVLASTNRPPTRKVLVVGLDKGKIKNQNIIKRWKDIIEVGKLKKHSPAQKAILNVLRNGDGETEESLADNANLGRPSVRGRIAELNIYYGFKIINEDGKYKLIPNKKERDTLLKDTIEQINKIKSNVL